jgi:hypothetical protein
MVQTITSWSDFLAIVMAPNRFHQCLDTGNSTMAPVGSGS